MTGWATLIDIVGPENEIKRFTSRLGGPQEALLRVEAINAMPLEISSKNENDDARVSWCLENWGFSGNYDIYEAEYDPDRVRISLSTEGGPPDRLFEPMAKMFPELTFRIYQTEAGFVPSYDSPEMRWLLQGGRLIKVQSETDLDAEIRQRLTPGMNGKDAVQLAEWCATQKDLFSPQEWTRQIVRVVREYRSEKEAKTVEPARA